MSDLQLTFPASVEHIARARAAVAGYASRFVDHGTLAGVILATGEAAAELVETADPAAALTVDVHRIGGDLVVTLRRTGPGGARRRGLGVRLLHALAADVSRSTGPDGAEIALTFRADGGRAPATERAPLAASS